jgi:hypothetical protein
VSREAEGSYEATFNVRFAGGDSVDIGASSDGRHWRIEIDGWARIAAGDYSPPPLVIDGSTVPPAVSDSPAAQAP